MFKRGSISFKGICFLLAAVLFSTAVIVDVLGTKKVYANIYDLPNPTDLVSLSGQSSLPVLRGLRINPENPLNIEFIIDAQDSDKVSDEMASKMIRYFFAGLTVPEKDLWVNLSPYEQDRVMDSELLKTEVGEVLLGQDYILKQLSSSLTHPDTEIGKDYWKKTYQKLQKELGTSAVPVDTFNKVWIVPEKVEVFEDKNLALISEASLDTLFEEDYLALDKEEITKAEEESSAHRISSNLMKDLVLPNIKKDVNEGENFASLRQLYHSLILSAWFKKKFKESFYSFYIDSEKITGIDLAQEDAKDKVYDLYVKAFKKGVYDIMRKERDPVSSKSIKRRYFSGGAKLQVTPTMEVATNKNKILEGTFADNKVYTFNVDVQAIDQDNEPVSLTSSTSSSSLVYEDRFASVPKAETVKKLAKFLIEVHKGKVDREMLTERVVFDSLEAISSQEKEDVKVALRAFTNIGVISEWGFNGNPEGIDPGHRVDSKGKIKSLKNILSKGAKYNWSRALLSETANSFTDFETRYEPEEFNFDDFDVDLKSHVSWWPIELGIATSTLAELRHYGFISDDWKIQNESVMEYIITHLDAMVHNESADPYSYKYEVEAAKALIDLAQSELIDKKLFAKYARKIRKLLTAKAKYRAYVQPTMRSKEKLPRKELQFRSKEALDSLIEHGYLKSLKRGKKEQSSVSSSLQVDFTKNEIDRLNLALKIIDNKLIRGVPALEQLKKLKKMVLDEKNLKELIRKMRKEASDIYESVKKDPLLDEKIKSLEETNPLKDSRELIKSIGLSAIKKRAEEYVMYGKTSEAVILLASSQKIIKIMHNTVENAVKEVSTQGPFDIVKLADLRVKLLQGNKLNKFNWATGYDHLVIESLDKIEEVSKKDNKVAASLLISLLDAGRVDLNKYQPWGKDKRAGSRLFIESIAKKCLESKDIYEVLLGLDLLARRVALGKNTDDLIELAKTAVTKLKKQEQLSKNPTLLNKINKIAETSSSSMTKEEEIEQEAIDRSVRINDRTYKVFSTILFGTLAIAFMDGRDIVSPLFFGLFAASFSLLIASSKNIAILQEYSDFSKIGLKKWIFPILLSALTGMLTYFGTDMYQTHNGFDQEYKAKQKLIRNIKSRISEIEGKVSQGEHFVNSSKQRLQEAERLKEQVEAVEKNGGVLELQKDSLNAELKKLDVGNSAMMAEKVTVSDDLTHGGIDFDISDKIETAVGSSAITLPLETIKGIAGLTFSITKRSSSTIKELIG